MARGNFKPKRRVPEEEKSRLVSVRLNPRKRDHLWALDYIAAFDDEQERLPEDERRYRGDLIVEALMLYAGHERSEPTVTASAQDVRSIREIVEYILEKVEQGGIAAPRGRRKKEAPVTLSSSMAATVDRYLSGGFTGDAALDED